MSLAVDLLLGLYVGLLTGIVPALVSGVLGFVFRYFTGVTVPGLGVVVLAVAIAGVNGGLLGLNEPAIVRSPSLLIALVIVMMLSLYAHSQGDRLGETMPRHFSLRALRRQTLSADVISVVGGIGHVTVRPAGEVDDLEGYPPLPADLRRELSAGSWEFPADVPLAELASRLEDRLRTEHDLADVVASIDSEGRATVAAAPPAGGLSRRVPDGQRAVSVAALVPTGVARGERVWIEADGERFEGTVVSARSGSTGGTGGGGEPVRAGDHLATDGGEEVEPLPTSPVAPTTTGGEGRVTVAVPRSRASALLAVDRGHVIVRSRGTRREFELLSLLRRSGERIARVTVRPGGSLDGVTLREAALRTDRGVEVLAVRDRAGPGRRGWTFSPAGSTELRGGDDLFVLGDAAALDGVREAAG